MYLGSHSRHLEDIFLLKNHKKIVEKLAKKIKEISKKTKVHAIAFTGMSGAGVAFPLSIQLNIPVLCIRKSDRDNHGRRIEVGSKSYRNSDCTQIKNYVIVDDLIETGKTVKRILKNISDDDLFYTYEEEKSRCVGILLYHASCEKYFNFNHKQIPVFYCGL